MAVDMAAQLRLPLCATTGCIKVGSPTMQSRGLSGRGERRDQRAHAEAADLLVIGEREMDRHRAASAARIPAPSPA